jgi:MYXO-CTERM domain-containing protein
MRTAIFLVVLAAAGVGHDVARAQVVFPADSAFLPLRCDNAPMTDPFADESGALSERDIVGVATAAAGLRASDDTNLYLRMRLEDDPAPGGQVRQFSWGMELDLDDDFTDYELLILVDGIAGAAGTVQLFRNTTTTLPDDPNDPADQPAAQTYMFANNARTVTAPGTNEGGDADFFLDFAIPWSALNAVGLDHDTPTTVWAATSSSANSLNGDFACHVGGSGPATLTDAASDPTTGDPTDPGANAGSGRLEGGAGCAASGGSNGVAFALLVLGALLALRRRG